MSKTEIPLVRLTAEAAGEIKKLMTEEPAAETAVLRVAVRGASCAGLEYALGFDQQALESDLVLAQHGVSLVVDPYSAPYLDGATIDFVDSGEEQGFAIENPNAASACGCGSTYRGEEEGAAAATASGCGGGCSGDGCNC